MVGSVRDSDLATAATPRSRGHANRARSGVKAINNGEATWTLPGIHAEGYRISDAERW